MKVKLEAVFEMDDNQISKYEHIKTLKQLFTEVDERDVKVELCTVSVVESDLEAEKNGHD